MFSNRGPPEEIPSGAHKKKGGLAKANDGGVDAPRKGERGTADERAKWQKKIGGGSQGVAGFGGVSIPREGGMGNGRRRGCGGTGPFRQGDRGGFVGIDTGGTGDGGRGTGDGGRGTGDGAE